jgi:hypothetical protein
VLVALNPAMITARVPDSARQSSTDRISRAARDSRLMTAGQIRVQPSSQSDRIELEELEWLRLKLLWTRRMVVASPAGRARRASAPAPHSWQWRS